MNRLKEPVTPTASASMGWLTILIMVVATSLFIVAHGCHGPDEDHEPGVHHRP
jgi:hypothetical protein